MIYSVFTFFSFSSVAGQLTAGPVAKKGPRMHVVTRLCLFESPDYV